VAELVRSQALGQRRLDSRAVALQLEELGAVSVPTPASGGIRVGSLCPLLIMGASFPSSIDDMRDHARGGSVGGSRRELLTAAGSPVSLSGSANTSVVHGGSL